MRRSDVTFKVGQKHHALMQHIRPYLIHIVAIIDETMVVYKYYGRYKRWWHYAIEHELMVENKIEFSNRWKKEKKNATRT